MVNSKTIATMKNLFKNLMLVAVAAMAFTACSEDNNEVNNVEKKTVISGVLNIVNDDTRSGFTGSYTEDEKTYYQSSWDGGETIKIFVDGVDDPVTTTIDKEGRFEVELDGELPESFFMTIVSPADSWSSKDISTIPAEQTPLANSVDPSAHILKVQNVQVTNGSADAAKMDHQAAYGKMTVNGVDFDIDHVVVNLKGTYYMNYERECTYTINADNVQNNVFWFTTETFENVTEFTVTAYDAEGKAVTKTVDVAAADKTLAFNYGRVSTFSVSGLEEPAVPMFTSAYASGYNTYDFTLTFQGNELSTLVLNPYYIANDDWTITPGTYSFSNSGGAFYTKGYSSYGDTDLYYGTVKISVVNGQYHFEFIKLADQQNNVVLEYATYTGEVEDLNVPDPRTPLATPNVTYSLDGNKVTLSWEPVEGAVGYRVRDYYYDIDTTTTELTVTAELTEYKWYYIYVSAIAAEDDANNKSSYETEIAFEHKDPRVTLSNPTNVVVTTDGANATISWDKVEGADYYQIYYYLEGDHEIDVTDSSVTIELGYSKSVWVYIYSMAYDTNPAYKSSISSDCYVQVITGRDPNVFADFVYDTLSWNSQYSRFELTGNGNDMTQFYLNSNDRPGNNSINTRTYTYAGNTVSNPGEGTFSLRYLLGSGAGSSHYVYDASMSVAFENGQYVILITVIDAGNSKVVGKTFGYKGMPEGWVAPSAGGDDNTGEGGDDNTGGEDPNPEQPDVTDEDFTNWNYDAVIDQGSGIVKLTDKSGTGRVVEFKLNEIAIAKFYGDTSKSSHFTDVKVDGVSATATAESWFQFGRSNQFFVEIDMTINGVHYSGKAASLAF